MCIGTDTDDRELVELLVADRNDPVDVDAMHAAPARAPRRPARRGGRAPGGRRRGSTRRLPPVSASRSRRAPPTYWVLGHLDRLGLRGTFAHVDVRGQRPAGEARARYLPRRVRGARRRAAARARGRGFAARDRGREGRGPAVRRGAELAHEVARPLGRRSSPRLTRRLLAARSGREDPRRTKIPSSDRPTARCPATGRAPTPSRPGRTPTRPTGARRRDRGGPRDSRRRPTWSVRTDTRRSSRSS